MKLSEINKFQGEKLKFIRLMNMNTLSEVGDYLELSHQLVSAWENNKKVPTFESILKLSKYFSVDRRYFFIPLEFSKLDYEIAFFRKKAAVAKKYQVQAEHVILKFSDIEEKIRNLISLPEYHEPNYSIKNDSFVQIDFDVIEQVAELVRKEYSLEIGPLPNMTLLCEKMGIRVHFVNLSSSDIDAATSFSNEKPIILLNSDRVSSAVRIRFNLAHELGHILLHSGYQKSIINSTSNHKRIEAEANYFASCLLLPEEGLLLDLTSTNMGHLLELKKHWRVSVQAIIYRAINMGVLSEKQSLFLYQQISRNKWRKKEPYDDSIKVEYPTLLKVALTALENKGIDWKLELSKATGYLKEDIVDVLTYENTKDTSPTLKIL